MNVDQRGNYRNPDKDARGTWNSAAYTCAKTADERPNLYYAIQQPHTGEEIWPSRTRVWAYDKERHAEHVSENMIYWGVDGKSKKPRLKKFMSDAKLVVPRTFWTPSEAGHNQEGKLELNDLGITEYFATPKPTRLIERVLSIGSGPNDLILDSFAGSGTTGHAVLKLNHRSESETPRRFILVEMESKITQDVTAERVRKAVQGYVNLKRERVEGLGGGFRYCRLADPLFDENGKIRDSVTFGELGRHVYFTETGEPLPRERVPNAPFLGECRGVGVYLLYNGILGDRSANGGNVLTRALLARLPRFDGQRVVYCASCLLGRDRLRAERIVVRQIPYEIKVS